VSGSSPSHNRLDLAGQVFGKLTAIGIVAQTRYGSIWECRCACGARQTRSAARLRISLKLGQEAGCFSCVGVTAFHRSEDGHRYHEHRRLVMRFDATDDLYQPDLDPFYEQEIRDDIAAVLGCYPTIPMPRGVLAVAGW